MWSYLSGFSGLSYTEGDSSTRGKSPVYPHSERTHVKSICFGIRAAGSRVKLLICPHLGHLYPGKAITKGYPHGARTSQFGFFRDSERDRSRASTVSSPRSAASDSSRTGSTRPCAKRDGPRSSLYLW